jgi:F0F1-type ATP synthase epsilon subunit
MVKLTGKDGKMEFEITGGVIEVLNNKVIVLAESI